MRQDAPALNSWLSTVQAAAKKYLDPSRLQIVAVADPSKVDLFKQFGTVEVYDTNGKRIGQ